MSGMKYRAETMGVTVDGHTVGSYSQSMQSINEWAHLIAKKYNCDVKIYETYERVLTIVKKPYQTTTTVSDHD